MNTSRTPLMDISNNDVTSSPVATGSRRKSGRATKAPEKFVPDVPSSQPGPASAKRKRGEEDAENDASDLEDEEAEESDDTIESAGEEEVRESRKKAKTTKKPAAKKPKVNGTVSHDEAPHVPLPSRPKKAGKKVAIADKDAEGLYAEVYTSGDSSEDVASLWLNRYNANNPEAMTELVNFVLKSAGCSLRVTEDDINDPENVEGRLGDLQEEYQAQNITDYPLISKAKSVHAFRSSLVGFFDQLIKAMHKSGVMYEEIALIENIHLWVATMSSSTTRPFRHTATVIALAITSAMCAVAHKEITVAAQTLRQLEAEKKKKSANRARLADFQKKVTTGEQKKEFLESQIKDFFDTVYVHRYRDIDPKIRTECVEALGNWIVTLESVFFDGTYLRYMGWMLSDTHSTMRHEVIKQLTKIMKTPDSAGGMRHFIERFRPRLVEMATRDSDPAVRADAVDLMDLIRQAGMLEPDDIDVIGKLIFDTEPKVRRAVVGFFAASINDLYEVKVEELGGEEALEDTLTVEDEEDFDTPRIGWLRLKTLAEILTGYDSEDQQEDPSQIDAIEFLNVSGKVSRFTLAAEALYDKVPELKEWEMLAGYLLFDHSAKSKGSGTEKALKATFKPTEKEELIMLEILNAVVKLSLTQGGDTEKSKKQSAKMEILEAKQTAARRLAALIPRLLKKYGADPNTAKIVLRLEQILNLRVFKDLRQDATVYAKLLDEISAQFNGHADKGVLTEASAALLHARSYEELEEVTESKIQSMWEVITNTLWKLNKAREMSVRGSLRNKPLHDLSHTMSRLEELSSISNSVEPLEAESGKNEPQPIDILLDVVARGVFEMANDETIDSLEDQVALSAIRSSMFYFMWKTRALIESVSSGDGITDLEIDQLKERQDTFTRNVVAAFSSRSTLDPIRLTGAGTLLDLYVLFAALRPTQKSKSKKHPAAKDVESNNPYLQTAIKEIIPEVQVELTSVFDALEKQYAKKSKKRLAEPSDDEEPEDLDSEPEDDEDEDATASERHSETLKAEHQLCELTGKLVFAIIAQVLDASGPLKGKLRSRIQRNRQRLGPSFKDVVAYLDEPKSKSKKGQKSKTQQAPDASKNPAKSTEIVEEEEEEDEDDVFADVEPEEGTVGDLRRRELLDEEPPASVDEDGEDAGEGEDDNMLGD